MQLLRAYRSIRESTSGSARLLGVSVGAFWNWLLWRLSYQARGFWPVSAQMWLATVLLQLLEARGEVPQHRRHNCTAMSSYVQSAPRWWHVNLGKQRVHRDNHAYSVNWTAGYPYQPRAIVKEPALISQTTEYALRAIVDLAYHFGESRTTQQIAEATKVPQGYLAKVLKDLSRHGLVRSQRGLHGGFTLDRDPDYMTVYDVMAAVDPPRRILTCPLGLEAHKNRLCPLHKRLDEAMAAAEKAFRETAISDVTARPDDSTQALGGKSAALTISAGLAAAPARGRSKSSRQAKRR